MLWGTLVLRKAIASPLDIRIQISVGGTRAVRLLNQLLTSNLILADLAGVAWLSDKESFTPTLRRNSFEKSWPLVTVLLEFVRLFMTLSGCIIFDGREPKIAQTYVELPRRCDHCSYEFTQLISFIGAACMSG